MTRSEAQEKAASLEALHPWIGDYEWTVRQAGDDNWVVVKIAATPDMFSGRPNAAQNQASPPGTTWGDPPQLST